MSSIVIDVWRNNILKKLDCVEATMLKLTSKDFYDIISIQEHTVNFFHYCGIHNYLGIIKWFKEDSPTWFFASQDKDCYAVVKELSWGRSMCDGAVEGGHLDILLWTQKNSYHQSSFIQGSLRHTFLWRDEIAITASKLGYTNIIEWALPYRFSMDYAQVSEILAKKGNLELLKKIYTISPGLSFSKVLSIASRYNHLEIIQWAHEIDLLDSTVTKQKVCRTATKYHNVKILEWMSSNNMLRAVQKLCKYAIRSNCIETLRFVISHGCPWSLNALEIAAKEGSADIFRYTYQETAGYAGEACRIAARCGHLAILKYLFSVGYISKRMRRGAIYQIAESNHHQHILDWIAETS